MVTDKNASIIIIILTGHVKKKSLSADNEELNEVRAAIYDLQLWL